MMTQNHNASNICKTPYVNPDIKKYMNGFVPLMTCTLCYQLFNAERTPRIFNDGRTFCLVCMCRLVNDPPHIVKQLHPLNISYVNKFLEFKSYLDIMFSRQLTTYCELERAIYDNNNYIYMRKPWSEVLVQRAMHTEDITQYFKKFIIIENQDERIPICKALTAVENFKTTSLSTTCTNLLENFSKLITPILAHGPSSNINSQLRAEADWLKWNSNGYSNYELKSSATKNKNSQGYVSKALDTNAVLEVDNKLRYSMLQSINSGLRFPSFMPDLPPLSDIGITEFVLFDDQALVGLNAVYFEVNIAYRTIVEDVNASLVGKFNITLTAPNLWQDISYLFLGSVQSFFKGGEIEVTNELIIFDSLLQNGALVPAKLPEPFSKQICNTPMKIKEGMVLITVIEQSTKLVVLKHSRVETGFVCYGEIENLSMDALRLLPLGKHKIIGCGIEVIF